MPIGFWKTDYYPINGFLQFCRAWKPAAASGLPVLALHGSLTQSGMWIELAERAGSISMTCPDQRGFGRSEDPGVDACAEFTSDAVAVAGKLLPSRYVVMGHSFACTIALQVARKVGDQIAAVVLVDPVVHMGNAAAQVRVPPVVPPELFATVEACERHFRDSEEGDWSDEALRRFVQDIMMRDENGAWHFPYTSARLRRLRTFTASSQNDFNLIAGAKAVHCPVLAFRGAMSKRFPANAEQPFFDAFRLEPRIVLCSKSGHFPAATDVNIIATELKRFLHNLPESR